MLIWIIVALIVLMVSLVLAYRSMRLVGSQEEEMWLPPMPTQKGAKGTRTTSAATEAVGTVVESALPPEVSVEHSVQEANSLELESVQQSDREVPSTQHEPKSVQEALERLRQLQQHAKEADNGMKDNQSVNDGELTVTRQVLGQAPSISTMQTSDYGTFLGSISISKIPGSTGPHYSAS